MQNINKINQVLPKEHGRCVVTSEQGDYIAKRLRVLLKEKHINSLEDEIALFVKLAKEYNKYAEEQISAGNNVRLGKHIEGIKTTTFYDFLKKHGIVPYSKRKLSSKSPSRTLPIDDEDNGAISDKQLSTCLSFTQLNSNAFSHYNDETLQILKAENENKMREAQQKLAVAQIAQISCDFKNIQVQNLIDNYPLDNIDWSYVQKNFNFEDKEIDTCEFSYIELEFETNF